MILLKVNVMCNLSDGLVEQVTKDVTDGMNKKYILNMNKKGFSINQIAEIAEMSISDVKVILNKIQYSH